MSQKVVEDGADRRATELNRAPKTEGAPHLPSLIGMMVFSRRILTIIGLGGRFYHALRRLRGYGGQSCLPHVLPAPRCSRNMLILLLR
jgi:hypothetical protein